MKMKKYDFITKEFLEKEYSRNKKSLKQIAYIVGCCMDTIRRNLVKYGIYIRGSNETRKGKELTEQHKKKISRGLEKSSWYNPERHKKHYCKEIGCNNRIIYDTWKYGQGMCRKCADEKHSRWLKGRFKGKDCPAYGKLPTHSRWAKYKDIWMRSNWEILYAIYLDSKNIKWQYEPKTFDLGDTTYCPDFYLPKKDLYIEIKGYWRDDAKQKFELFRIKYPKTKIKVLMKEQLQEMKVIGVK